MDAPRRSTSVIEGPLAFQMRRLAAARNGESGLQILSLAELAAHLAGGFSYPASKEIIEPAIQASLDQGGFEELDAVRHLPGMTRAVARSLRRAWGADVDLSEVAGRVGARRLKDLAMIEQRVRLSLPPAACCRATCGTWRSPRWIARPPSWATCASKGLPGSHRFGDPC